MVDDASLATGDTFPPPAPPPLPSVEVPKLLRIPVEAVPAVPDVTPPSSPELPFRLKPIPAAPPRDRRGGGPVPEAEPRAPPSTAGPAPPSAASNAAHSSVTPASLRSHAERSKWAREEEERSRAEREEVAAGSRGQPARLRRFRPDPPTVMASSTWGMWDHVWICVCFCGVCMRVAPATSASMRTVRSRPQSCCMRRAHFLPRFWLQNGLGAVSSPSKRFLPLLLARDLSTPYEICTTCDHTSPQQSTAVTCDTAGARFLLPARFTSLREAHVRSACAMCGAADGPSSQLRSRRLTRHVLACKVGMQVVMCETSSNVPTCFPKPLRSALGRAMRALLLAVHALECSVRSQFYHTAYTTSCQGWPTSNYIMCTCVLQPCSKPHTAQEEDTAPIAWLPALHRHTCTAPISGHLSLIQGTSHWTHCSPGCRETVSATQVPQWPCSHSDPPPLAEHPPSVPGPGRSRLRTHVRFTQPNL